MQQRKKQRKRNGIAAALRFFTPKAKLNRKKYIRAKVKKIDTS
jgi:hypothetical protein